MNKASKLCSGTIWIVKRPIQDPERANVICPDRVMHEQKAIHIKAMLHITLPLQSNNSKNDNISFNQAHSPQSDEQLCTAL